MKRILVEETGDDSALGAANNLDWTRKSACRECPFLKTTKHHEGIAASLVNYAHSIDEGKFCHTCHKTDNRSSCDGPRNYKGERPQHCYGAIMMQLKSNEQMPIQSPLMNAASQNLLKPSLLFLARRAKNDSRFFTWWELLTYYAKWLRETEKDEM